MSQPPEHVDVLVAQREVRHLQSTIVALRDEMESIRTSQELTVQEAAVNMDSEIRQLQETVAVLRDQLEDVQQSAQQQVHDAEWAAKAEVDQYKETIRELRQRLEQKGEDDG